MDCDIIVTMRPGYWPFTIWVALVAGCRQPAAETVKVSAAISTREALQKVAEHFQTATGVRVEPDSIEVPAVSIRLASVERGAFELPSMRE